MILLSTAFDLGRDKTRIKDERDAWRQRETAAELLKRLFHGDANKRWELQILADEVGMGKTFVALAVAYSLLETMRNGETPPDLEGCYQKVVIITPPNGALLAKWYREVSEFVKRCVHPDKQAEALAWFKPAKCKRLDEFVRALRKRGGGGPRVIIAPMDVFGEGKLKHYDSKRRFLLGALFRYWGNGFQMDRRAKFLLGSPSDWPKRPEELSQLEEWEADEIPCTEEEAVACIRFLDRPGDDGSPSPIERLFKDCREMSEPYARDRDAYFAEISKNLNWVYREMLLSLFESPVPLVIIDEAHNWKNGPKCGANGYEFFERYLASRTRRALLLTATPFQLRPQEMLELLKIGEALQPAPERSGAEDRRLRFRRHREGVLQRVLERSDQSSRNFARLWSNLVGVTPADIAGIWDGPRLASARREIDGLAARSGVISEKELQRVVGEAAAGLDPAVRGFYSAALVLYAHNCDLSSELGLLVVRHRRKTNHRVFRVGHEYGGDSNVEQRPDRHLLHGAPGLDVRGEPELPHYLLMRCISDTKNGRGRSSLGSALTGCYSTLLESSEGRRVKSWIAGQPESASHFKLLLDLVDRKQDPEHPKLSIVVDEVLKAWRQGQKSLIFCFRTNTAERLHDIIRKRITDDLSRMRGECLGGEASLTALRGRITRRDGDLIPLGLDRVLWSMAASAGFGEGWPFGAEELRLQDGDILELAKLCLKFGFDLDDEKPDRVFLSRSVECVVARRLLQMKPRGRVGGALEEISRDEWVEWPYGLSQRGGADDDGDGDHLDLRGVRTRYPLKISEPDIKLVKAMADRIERRRGRARAAGDTPIVDVDSEGPSLWFGDSPFNVIGKLPPLVRLIHEHLAELSVKEGQLDWESRRRVFEALRRALLRDSVLVRLLPTKTERQERAWGALLVESFWTSMKGQHESMANRLEVFLEDLRGASGSFDDLMSARGALLDATRLRDQRFVALVKGGDAIGRERVFAGFNTPLLPEVLVCTQVGAEGIDLHRHCRHVIHYDLAWNPAVLEQRTGRVDRIGSKTFRERSLGGSSESAFLEVGVPYLAGTYDERMYEELRLRAQIFEVLTGGDVAGENVEGQDDVANAEGAGKDLGLIHLPPNMESDLRVQLHWWQEKTIS